LSDPDNFWVVFNGVRLSIGDPLAVFLNAGFKAITASPMEYIPDVPAGQSVTMTLSYIASDTESLVEAVFRNSTQDTAHVADCGATYLLFRKAAVSVPVYTLGDIAFGSMVGDISKVFGMSFIEVKTAYGTALEWRMPSGDAGYGFVVGTGEVSAFYLSRFDSLFHFSIGTHTYS
jgi:hypothetical protein